MSEKNKEIIEKVNAAWLEGKPEGFLEFCADDVQWRVVGDKTLVGKDDIRDFISQCAGEAAEQPPQFSVDQLVAEGDTVAAYGDMTMKENGTDVSYSYVDWYRFRNDEIVQLQSFVVKHKTADESEQAAAA